jgi:hypothetical protein
MKSPARKKGIEEHYIKFGEGKNYLRKLWVIAYSDGD